MLCCANFNFFTFRLSSILSFSEGATAFETGGRRKVEICSSAPAKGGKFRSPSFAFAEKEAGANKMEGERKVKECDLAQNCL